LVYPQFEIAQGNIFGQMRGTDNHECIQQEEASQCAECRKADRKAAD
jgi:hypothetical protein